MSKLRTCIVLFSVLGFGALGAVPASAGWFVGGTELKGAAALSTTASLVPHSTILVPNLGDLTILCPGIAILHITNGTLLTTSPVQVLHADSFRFLRCATVKPATGCALEGGEQTIPTLPITGTPTLGSGTEDRITFTPTTKSTFAEIKFSETNTCAFSGTEPVKGSVKLGAPTGQTEEVAQSIVGLGSTENNSLEIGTGNKAFLGGSALVTLASGSKWSFK